MQVGQNWWLSIWSNTTTIQQKEHRPLQNGKYITVYVALGLASLGLQGGRALLLVLGSFNASRRLHVNLLAKVMRLPMAFFDSQPTGRLLNRCASDPWSGFIILCAVLHTSCYNLFDSQPTGVSTHWYVLNRCTSHSWSGFNILCAILHTSCYSLQWSDIV